MTNRHSTTNGYTLSGPLRGVPFGRAVLVVNGGYTVGRVYTPEGVYAIHTTGSLQTVERLKPEPLRCEVMDSRETETETARSGVAWTPEPGPGVGGLDRKRAVGTVGEEPSSAGGAPKGATSGSSLTADDDVDVLVVYPS